MLRKRHALQDIFVLLNDCLQWQYNPFVGCAISVTVVDMHSAIPPSRWRVLLPIHSIVDA